MNALKELIKEKAALQPVYKNQRKTVNLVGERTIAPDTATAEHKYNREDLKELYIAYTILREKDPLLACAGYKDFSTWELNRIQTIIDRFQSEFIREVVHTS